LTNHTYGVESIGRDNPTVQCSHTILIILGQSKILCMFLVTRLT